MNSFNPDCTEIIAERKRNSNSANKRAPVNQPRKLLHLKIEAIKDNLALARLIDNAIQVG